MPKLTIITTHPNEHHATTEETQQSTNKPFKRHFQILDQLRNIYPKDNFVYVDEPINYIEKELRKYPCVDPTYLEFLKNAYISYCCSRHKHNNEDLQSLDHGLVNYCFSKNMNVDLSKIPYHVQCGIYGNDFCTSIFDHTYETALRSAYNGLVAANHLEKDSIIYCANVFPGHHASPKLYSGYCFLNNTAICAQRLLERYDRITILDIDFHAGDGTQRIFYKDRRVLTISIHADPTNEYPFYYGFANEVGEGDGENYNFNYPVDTNIYNISCDVYLQLLNQALDLMNLKRRY